MICHHYRCIFIHQRKTAGSSLKESFGLNRNEPDWHAFNDGRLSKKPNWCDKIKKYDDYFVFSVVRNPWDRFISGWKYCESTRHRDLLDVAQNMPKEGHDYRHLTRPQLDIITDEQGHLLTDFIIRFENLQSGFDQVCDVIGKPKTKLPIRKVSRRLPYTDYFDEQSRDLVTRAFEEDIEAFGYEFGEDSFRPQDPRG